MISRVDDALALVHRALLGLSGNVVPFVCTKSGSPATRFASTCARKREGSLGAGYGAVADQGILRPPVAVGDRTEVVLLDPARRAVTHQLRRRQLLGVGGREVGEASRAGRAQEPVQRPGVLVDPAEDARNVVHVAASSR